MDFFRDRRSRCCSLVRRSRCCLMVLPEDHFLLDLRFPDRGAQDYGPPHFLLFTSLWMVIWYGYRDLTYAYHMGPPTVNGLLVTGSSP